MNEFKKHEGRGRTWGRRGLSGTAALVLAAGLFLLGGCQQTIPPSDMTLSRGAQLLAAGSPKSAIPFLEQTVTATPDGPEPMAMLALAYALDLQPDRAIGESKLVHRGKESGPGWEVVAVGIAEMTQHRPGAAAGRFESFLQGSPGSRIAPTARQWLVLAQVLNGEHEKALASLQAMGASADMQTSALLWTALLQANRGRSAAGAAALTKCAASVVSGSGELALAGNLTAVDDQTLYDAGIAALAKGDVEAAHRMLALVYAHNPEGCDAPVWLALIAGVREDWTAARARLKEACVSGSAQSRGLANELFSVVCAAEDRPDALIEHTLAGQRILDRASNPTRTVDQPQPEGVWGADNMK